MVGSLPGWVDIVSLTIALVGGIPGIVTVVDRLRTRAKFRAFVQAWTVGVDTSIEPGVEYTMMLLTVTLTNAGKETLSPARFDFWCELDGRKVMFRSFLIPERLKLYSDEQNIELSTSAALDLQRVATPINHLAPVHGNLMFVTPHQLVDRFRARTEPIQSAIVCTDVLNRKHSAPVTLIRDGPAFDRPTSFPHQGLTVRPRKER